MITLSAPIEHPLGPAGEQLDTNWRKGGSKAQRYEVIMKRLLIILALVGGFACGLPFGNLAWVQAEDLSVAEGQEENLCVVSYNVENLFHPKHDTVWKPNPDPSLKGREERFPLYPIESSHASSGLRLRFPSWFPAL